MDIKDNLDMNKYFAPVFNKVEDLNEDKMWAPNGNKDTEMEIISEVEAKLRLLTVMKLGVPDHHYPRKCEM